MYTHIHLHTHSHTQAGRAGQHQRQEKQSANALLRGPLLKSKINDNYLRENARINNLQEATLKLYLKDTHRLISTVHITSSTEHSMSNKHSNSPSHSPSLSPSAPSALGSVIGIARITMSTRVKQTFCGSQWRSDAPLKIKSSLIKQIIHLLYFQHNAKQEKKPRCAIICYRAHYAT